MVYTWCIHNNSFMTTKIRQWGNSLAVRLPKTATKAVDFLVDSEVSLIVENGDIIIRRAPQKKDSLAKMIEEMTDDNIHNEISFGDAVGKEVW